MTSKRGGARPGSGNKAKDGATMANTLQVCARIRKDQHAQWLALGGSEWLRGQIDAQKNAPDENTGQRDSNEGVRMISPGQGE